jgi:hypothetical protein
MFDTHCRSRAVMTALLALPVAASACDPAADPAASDLEIMDVGQVPRADTVQIADSGHMPIPSIEEEEFAQQLLAEMGPAAGNPKCKFDSFRFRLADDLIALTSPPGGFFTAFPAGIPTFDDAVLEDSYIFVVTMRDAQHNVVGFASEQEVVDLVNNKTKTAWAITVPDRGTLMLTERESVQVLVDAVSDMVADQELVRVFDPPLVVVSTIPGTGKVAGGSDEFANAVGVMQEINTVYEIDLINNEYDIGVVVQVLHC